MITYRGHNKETGETVCENSKAHLWAKICITINLKTKCKELRYMEIGEMLAEWEITEI